MPAAWDFAIQDPPGAKVPAEVWVPHLFFAWIYGNTREVTMDKMVATVAAAYSARLEDLASIRLALTQVVWPQWERLGYLKVMSPGLTQTLGSWRNN